MCGACVVWCVYLLCVCEICVILMRCVMCGVCDVWWLRVRCDVRSVWCVYICMIWEIYVIIFHFRDDRGKDEVSERPESDGYDVIHGCFIANKLFFLNYFFLFLSLKIIGSDFPFIFNQFSLFLFIKLFFLIFLFIKIGFFLSFFSFLFIKLIFIPLILFSLTPLLTPLLSPISLGLPQSVCENLESIALVFLCSPFSKIRLMAL